MEKYYLIVVEEDWIYDGNSSTATNTIRIGEYDTLEKAKKEKRKAFDDSLIIKGTIIEGDFNAFR